jgi:hypothetical protein
MNGGAPARSFPLIDGWYIVHGSPSLSSALPPDALGATHERERIPSSPQPRAASLRPVRRDEAQRGEWDGSSGI